MARHFVPVHRKAAVLESLRCPMTATWVPAPARKPAPQRLTACGDQVVPSHRQTVVVHALPEQDSAPRTHASVGLSTTALRIVSRPGGVAIVCHDAPFQRWITSPESWAQKIQTLPGDVAVTSVGAQLGCMPGTA